MRIKAKQKECETSKDILILADFSEGLWDAIAWSMKVLFRKGFIVRLLETYQKPQFGQSVLKDITPLLRKIAKDDLVNLHDSLTFHFNISTDEIKLHSVKGDLLTILCSGIDLTNNHCIIVNTSKYFSPPNFFRTLKFIQIAKRLASPVFFLPHGFTKDTNFNILVVSDQCKVITNKMLEIIENFFPGVRHTVHFLSDDINMVVEDNQSILPAAEQPQKTKVHYLESPFHFKDIALYMNQLDGDLLVIGRNQKLIFRSYMNFCLMGMHEVKRIPVLFV